MTTPLLTGIAPRPALAPATARLNTLLIATDGTPEADDALMLAQAIAARHNADVQVVTVLSPSYAELARDPLSPALPAGTLVTEREGRRAQVERQLRRTLGPDTSWPVATAAGPFDTALASIANTAHAELILTGRGRKSLLARLLAEDHVLRALRSGDVPVLAVEEGSVTLPNRAVIAVDFSEHSLRAARVAQSVLDDTSTVYLVHVARPPGIDVRQGDAWNADREAAMRTALEQVRATLAFPASMNVECIVLRGHAASAIAAFARESAADLVVSGSHGLGFVHRVLVGSVAAQLLRTAVTSVLCVPPARDELEAALALGARRFVRAIPAAEWAVALQRFAATHRHNRMIVSTPGAAGPRRSAIVRGLLLDITPEEGGFILDLSTLGGARGERMHDVVAASEYSDPDGTVRAVEIEHSRGATRITPE